MSTVKIESADKAIALLQQQVTEKGFAYHYVEPGESKTCRYIESDDAGGYKAGCIVGHVLLQLGYEPSFDQEMAEAGDPTFDTGIEETAASALVNHGSIQAPPIVGVILDAAQAAQDNGQSWGQALAAARLVNDAYKLGQRAVPAA